MLRSLLLMSLVMVLSHSGHAVAQEDWLKDRFNQQSRQQKTIKTAATWKYRGVRRGQESSLARIASRKGVRLGNEVFIRIFKQESQLELWMKKGPRFTLVKTYPICKWSGSLGPKRRQGDKQAPEGFYRVSRKQMNPNSSYHLSFNLGYPNRLERQHRRTGSYLMVHGKCVSAGCYAMTDPVIEEIYGIMTKAFNAGQNTIHVHAFPFRMTAANIDRYGQHKWAKFWWNLKQGYDIFEATLLPPKTEACEKNYVFNPPPLNAEGIANPSWTCMMRASSRNKVKTAGYQ